MPKLERTAAILVAAGRGLRAGSGGPKQYRSIGGQTVIFRAMAPFCRHPQIFAVQPVLNPDDTVAFNEAVSEGREAIRRRDVPVQRGRVVLRQHEHANHI